MWLGADVGLRGASTFVRPLFKRAQSINPAAFDPREALPIYARRALIGVGQCIGMVQNVFPVDLVAEPVETVLRLFLRFGTLSVVDFYAGVRLAAKNRPYASPNHRLSIRPNPDLRIAFPDHRVRA
jgi:hypothetical protein